MGVSNMIDNNNLVQRLQTDLDSAKGNHAQQMALIEEWRAESEGYPYATKAGTDNYNAVVNKLIKKTIETATPSLVEPFLGNNIVNAQGRDSESDAKAEVASSVLNYF